MALYLTSFYCHSLLKVSKPVFRYVNYNSKFFHWSIYDLNVNKNKLLLKKLFTGIGVVTFSGLIYHQTCTAKANFEADSFEKFGVYIQGLKDYKRNEVLKHDSLEKGIWVIYKNGVYDITKFVGHHPGGDNILLGAGIDIEPFWNLYASHKTEKIFKLLEKFRIGNVDPNEPVEESTEALDPYSNDPKRIPILSVRSKKPFNAEPPLKILADHFLTPNDIFFIRNHLPVPEIDLKDYVLEIQGLGLKKAYKLTLKDLKTKFPRYSINATLQCAGNRRSEMNNIKEVKGLSWGSAAISNAKWTGVKLVDVLKYCKLNFNDKTIKHLQFEGLDTDATGASYGASCPAETALDPKSDFLLAFEMNDEPLPKDHGFPVRLIAPGIVGARNVKWLSKIVISDEESPSHWQRKDYKSFSPNVNWDNVDFDSAYSIQEYPIQSVICNPVNGDVVEKEPNGFVKTKGYAWSGGGKKIIRVDVSVDSGLNWITADLKQDSTPLNRTWSWTIWEAKVPIDEKIKSGFKVELICKAVDSSYNTQPENCAPIWNLRGLLTNCWHKVVFTVV